MRRRLIAILFAAFAASPLAAQEAQEDPLQGLEIIGKPDAAAMGFQPAATSLANDIHWLDSLLLVIITGICLLVIGLMAWVAVRYRRDRNPDPSTFTHNSPVEIAWTVVPILILVVIGSFSLPVLFNQQEIPEGDITIKTTGYQWYWGYEYPDYDFEFQSYMIGAQQQNMLTDETRAQLQAAGYSEDEFRLATDTAMVVPVGKTIVLQVTGADVIHSWTVPAFGVKQDAVPGRLAELWFRPEREGVYFGQCSELCGISHAYMPITVKVVSEEAYQQWLASAVEEYGGTWPEGEGPPGAQQVQAGDAAAPEPGTDQDAQGAISGEGGEATSGGEGAGGSGSAGDGGGSGAEGGQSADGASGGSGGGESGSGEDPPVVRGNPGAAPAEEGGTDADATDTPPASRVIENTEVPSGVGSSSDAIVASPDETPQDPDAVAPEAGEGEGDPAPDPNAGGQEN